MYTGVYFLNHLTNNYYDKITEPFLSRATKETYNFRANAGSTTVYKLVHPEAKTVFIMTNTISARKQGYLLLVIFALHLYSKKISVLLLNLRGHDERLDNDHHYLCTPADDLFEILYYNQMEFISAYTNRVLFGISLGANLFGAFLGRFERIFPEGYFTYYVSVSNPFSMHELTNGTSHNDAVHKPIYNSLYLYLSNMFLQRSIQSYFKFNGREDLSSLLRDDFEASFSNLIAPCINNYYSVASFQSTPKLTYVDKKKITPSDFLRLYSDLNSTKPYITSIKTKGLYVHAIDDFITPITVDTIKKITKNPDNLLILTKRGFHCGFLEDSGNHYIISILDRLVEFCDL
jgi:predicted alpha/beta-fold hydrolase